MIVGQPFMLHPIREALGIMHGIAPIIIRYDSGC